jgi:transposase
MERYIGLDVHRDSCTVAVVGPSGKRLKSIVVETNGSALVEVIRSIPGRRHICLEEGTQSAWLHEVLSPHAEEVVVVVPEKRRGPKSDRRDAWTRAEELRTGAITTRVYKAATHLSALKNAVRGHLMVVRDVVRVKNRLKAIWRSRGVRTTDGVYEPSTRGRWIKRLPAAHRSLAEGLGQQLDVLEPLREQAERSLIKEAKSHPIIRKIATAPGMGRIRSAEVVAVVATPHRFRTRQQFWSYCGLAIVTRSSADWVYVDGHKERRQVQQTRGLTRKRNPLLKQVFKGAATTVVTQLTDHPLHEDYQRMIDSGIKPNLARITLARRISAIVLSMWKHQEVYNPSRHRVVTDQQ